MFALNPRVKDFASDKVLKVKILDESSRKSISRTSSRKAMWSKFQPATLKTASKISRGGSVVEVN
jgi:hypothetical protein